MYPNCPRKPPWQINDKLGKSVKLGKEKMRRKYLQGVGRSGGRIVVIQ
jgi:hypothetical protein